MNTKLKITLQMFKRAVKNGMKVLHLDVETCLGTFCGFQIGSKVNLSYKQILTAPQVMCVQYKWEGDKKARYIEWDKIGERTVYDSGFCNKSLLEETSRIIEEADIIVGQNLNSFDMKMLRDGLVNNNLPALNEDLTLDILSLSRKSFRPLSHKLDARAHKYGYQGKVKMDLDDWIDVTFKGKPIKAKMGPYGCRDVEEEQRIFYREFNHYKLTRTLEKKIISFIPGLINEVHNIMSCSFTKGCGGNLQKKGFNVNKNGKVQRVFCPECAKSGVIK